MKKIYLKHCLAVAFIGLIGCVPSAASHRKQQRQIETARVWAHQKRLFFDIHTITTQSTNDKKASVERAIDQITTKQGESAIRCPICEQRYQINPRPESWKKQSGFTNEVAIYCDNPRHEGVLLFRFAGIVGKVSSVTDWVALQSDEIP